MAKTAKQSIPLARSSRCRPDPSNSLVRLATENAHRCPALAFRQISLLSLQVEINYDFLHAGEMRRVPARIWCSSSSATPRRKPIKGKLAPEHRGAYHLKLTPTEWSSDTIVTCSSGSAKGVVSNHDPYSDRQLASVRLDEAVVWQLFINAGQRVSRCHTLRD
jgi:hypothetical protein